MNNKENKDLFEQLVKRKLADYNAEVPVLGWENLESSLLATQKTKVVRKKWIISTLSAVAAALIGVFFVFQNMNRELPVQVSDHQVQKTESILADKDKREAPLVEKKITKKTQQSSQILIADNISHESYKTVEVHTSIIKEDEESFIIIPDNEEIEIAEKALENKKQVSTVDEETKQQLIEDFINEGKRTFTSSDETIRRKRKKKNSISLTGQAGLSGSQQTTSTPITLRSSLSETYGVYALNKMSINNDEVAVKPESEINHTQPVSFGVLTSFGLTRKLQIETGLVYTYLSSNTLIQSADYNESEKVQFHYLGVPVNLNYSLFSVNKLDMFVSVGAMIEKDISGRINYSDEKRVASSFNSGYASNNSSKIKQHNPQFSISSGLGITYPVYERTNIFGKIGGRYNINANNEFRTYYSDEKFGLDIQLGIKLNF